MIEVGRGRRFRRKTGIAAGLFLAALTAFLASARAEPSVSEVRIGRQEGHTRIAIALSEAVQFRAHVLGAPYRMVVDLPPVDWKLGAEARLDSPTVTAWRYGGLGKD